MQPEAEELMVIARAKETLQETLSPDALIGGQANNKCKATAANGGCGEDVKDDQQFLLPDERWCEAQ